jgi:phosphoenolpyruvate phosphomutase
MAAARSSKRFGLDRDQMVRIGGAHDALSARLIEQAGFPAIWLSGFGVSAAQFAMPDVNLVTLTESVEAARRICASVKIPVIVDADNGFGDVMNAARAVREYGCAGAAGVCIEDNTFPKRCSLYPGAPRQLLSIDEMCAKVAAARRAADPCGMFLIGRVESLIAGLGPEDAVARATAYSKVGADAILIHARDFGPLRQIAISGRIPKPLVLVPTLFHKVSFAEFAECGFAAVICANQLMRAMLRAGQAAAEKLLRADALSDLDPLISSLDEVNRLVHVPAQWCVDEARAAPHAAKGLQQKRRDCNERSCARESS